MSGASLANMLGASERSIRNYVTEINAAGERTIDSSKEGYRLLNPSSGQQRSGASMSAPTAVQSPSTPSGADARSSYVISHLVNAAGPLSIFDLASELCISESTLSSSVMPRVRELARRFGLSVETHDFQSTLTGLERDKRKLLGHIATHDSYGYFTSTQTLEEMFPEFGIQEILSRLVEICQRS